MKITFLRSKPPELLCTFASDAASSGSIHGTQKEEYSEVLNSFRIPSAPTSWQCVCSLGRPHCDFLERPTRSIAWTPTLLTRPCPLRLLVLSKTEKGASWKAFFPDPRPCKVCAFRTSEYSSFWVPWMLPELAASDAKVHRSSGGLLRRNVIFILFNPILV